MKGPPFQWAPNRMDLESKTVVTGAARRLSAVYPPLAFPFPSPICPQKTSHFPECRGTSRPPLSCDVSDRHKNE